MVIHECVNCHIKFKKKKEFENHITICDKEYEQKIANRQPVTESDSDDNNNDVTPSNTKEEQPKETCRMIKKSILAKCKKTENTLLTPDQNQKTVANLHLTIKLPDITFVVQNVDDINKINLEHIDMEGVLRDFITLMKTDNDTEHINIIPKFE